ncbi:MAG: hypothetical protein AAF399_24045 [Bacteroidota bacterium]
MKRFIRPVAWLFILAFAASLLLSSCRVFMGDPRKNCNHPDHGKYMKEQSFKRTGF